MVCDMETKKFIISFSGGKDGMLALYRAINEGHTPLGMITTYNENENKSWFHNIPKSYLEKVSKSLNIPLYLINTNGDDYTEKFEEKLLEFKENGVDFCVFGDIDIIEHFNWCSCRCKNVGMDYYFPLWNEDRKKVVNEFIGNGFKALITVVKHTKMDKSFVGQTLSNDLVLQIEKTGADICGENGEYHTFVYDGPLFLEKIDLLFTQMESLGDYTRISFI